MGASKTKSSLAFQAISLAIVALSLLLHVPWACDGFSIKPLAFRSIPARFSTTGSVLFSVKTTACKDGRTTVSRTFVPSPKEGEEGADLDSISATLPRDPISKDFSLAFKVFRPMNLSSQKACPVLCLHGGPSVPSDYLFPLVDVVPYRSIIFFDQLGCGRSDSPEHIDAYSIDKGVDDLEALIKQLGLRQFHLFGQSFGGILGYEFLKRIAERKERNPSYEILSFCMSSSPSNVMEVEEAANSLLEALLAEDPDESTIEERFQSNHICRSTERPQPLIDAYAHAGTIWRGSNVIADYVAQPPMEGSALLPPTMVMRGEFDFVTSSCLTPWKEKIWNHGRIREKVLTGCAHHGLLENGQLYGDLVDSFFTEYDP